VSVDYVVRLEQGRSTAPSAQVVASLARALQLTAVERDHLYRMAGLVPPNDEPIPDHIPPGVHRVLNRLGDVAVAVFAADWQLIWWNPGWAALLGDPSAKPPEQRNFARERFPVGSGDGVRTPYRLVAGAGAERRQPRTSPSCPTCAAPPAASRTTCAWPELIRQLTAGNATFARLWASGTVAAHREDRKTVEHPEVGPVDVDCDVLTDGDSDLKIVILTAAPGSSDETKLRRTLAGDSLRAPTG
jgi:hypothetical protein